MFAQAEKNNSFILDKAVENKLNQAIKVNTTDNGTK